jgi:hypothetical protein
MDGARFIASEPALVDVADRQIGGGPAGSAPGQYGSQPVVVEAPADSPRRCRCGIRIPERGWVLEIGGLPPSLGPLFAGRSYCSVQCVRADFLESFETLDAMLGSPGEPMVDDLRVVYRELGWAFASITGRPSAAKG